jgi:cytochrome P450
MLFAAGTDHKRLRHSVRDVFTRSFISGLEEGVEIIASQTIDHLPAGVEFDFLAEGVLG